MADEVVVITPETEPGAGGLADYSLRLAEEWGSRAKVRFQRSAEKLPRDGGKILLQYSAYGYDRVGYPRSLLRGLIEWRSESRDARLVLMLHEIWTFWPLLNKNRLIQHFHGRALRKLIAASDAVFTSTPSQAEHLRELTETGSIQVLPVGSNIRVTASGVPREMGLAVVFGLPAARLRALREMHAELKALAGAGVIRRLVTTGRSAPDEQELLASLDLREGFQQCGSLSEAEVSELLACASFGVSAQDELSLMKSGTFMAYAAHGLNIISPYGDSLGPEPICWLTRPRDLRQGVAADELERRAQSLRVWQERTSSWREIAERFAEALQLEKADAG